MSKLVVALNVTLDDVIQSPSHQGEDPRDGFEHGGWAAPYEDDEKAAIMAEGIATTGALLFGRRTYEQFASVWPYQSEDNPYTRVLNEFPKLVASTTLSDPLEWANSSVLGGDAMEAVAGLKAEPGKDIVVLGSVGLVQSLLRHGLVDEFVLSVHPLVIGSGGRLFANTTYTPLDLVETRPTATGLVINTYRAGEPSTRSAA